MILNLTAEMGLSRVFSGHGWLLAVIGATTSAQGALWAARRYRAPGWLGYLLAALATSLVVCWSVAGGTTVAGLPGPATWDAISKAAGHLSYDIASTTVPVPETRSFLLVATAGAGFVGLASEWLRRTAGPLVGAAPAAGVVVFVSSLGRTAGRLVDVCLFAFAFALYLGVAATAEQTGVYLAGTPARTLAWRLRVVGGLAALGVLGVLLTFPAQINPDGRGLLGLHGGPGAGGGSRIVPNPVVSMQTQLLYLSNVPAFEVTSPLPSYWRLTSLSYFDGETWSNTGNYRQVSSALPGAQSVPAGTRRIAQTYNIEGLDSVWLPTAFDPYSVSGLSKVSWDPSSASLLTGGKTDTGMTYTVYSYQYLADLSPKSLASVPSPPAASVASYLQLPATMPADVVSLARSLTAGQSSEYAKALSIEQFLRSPAFSYSLHPPSDGTGVATLQNFLFVTRQGYCQQFASAFAVLARAAGVPTRLAVGFATGSPLGPDSYQVLGADAHSWPEVYFGQGVGWVPFEPTPGFADPSASTLDDTSNQSQSGSSPTQQAPVTSAPPTTLAPAINHKLLPQQGGGQSPQSASAHGQGVPSALWAILVLPALFLPLAGWGRYLAWRRSRRRQRATRAGPAAVVLESWQEVGEVLAERGLAKSPSETCLEFAQRVGRSMGRLVGEQAETARSELDQLAGLAAWALYAPDLPPDKASQASELGGRIMSSLRRHQTRPERWCSRLGVRAPRFR